jgi:hypothetical protein
MKSPGREPITNDGSFKHLIYLANLRKSYQ